MNERLLTIVETFDLPREGTCTGIQRKQEVVASPKVFTSSDTYSLEMHVEFELSKSTMQHSNALATTLHGSSLFWEDRNDRMHRALYIIVMRWVLYTKNF